MDSRRKRIYRGFTWYIFFSLIFSIAFSNINSLTKEILSGNCLLHSLPHIGIGKYNSENFKIALLSTKKHFIAA